MLPAGRALVAGVGAPFGDEGFRSHRAMVARASESWGGLLAAAPLGKTSTSFPPNAQVHGEEISAAWHAVPLVLRHEGSLHREWRNAEEHSALRVPARMTAEEARG